MNALLEKITGLQLLDPWLLTLILLVPARLWMRRRRGEPALLYAPARFLGPPPTARGGAVVTGTWRTRLVRLPRLLQVLALVLAVFALARPAERRPLPLRGEGLDILLCLDVSSSMAAKDMHPQRSRLDVVKRAASAFIARRVHDRIGLVCFARYPDLRCPPTRDHDALRELLDEVDQVERSGPEDATGIGAAVARCAQILRGEEAASTVTAGPDQVVILLTDGEENVATARTPGEIAPVHAAQLCREFSVRVYSIAAGIGAPDGKGGWKPLRTDQIRQLAERTGGRFFQAPDAETVGRVYEAIGQLETASFEEPRYEVVDRFLPFLVTGLALLLLARLLEAGPLEVMP